MEEGREIQVLEEEGWVRLVMPLRPPEFWFGSPELKKKIAAWVLGGFAMLMVSGWWWMVAYLCLKLWRNLRGNGGVLDWVVEGAGVILFTAFVAVFSWMLVVACCWRRLEILVGRDEIVELERCGPQRWRTRTKVADIKRIVLRACGNTQGKPLAERLAWIWLEGPEGGRRIAFAYPYPVAMAAAEELARRLERITTHAVEVEDTLDPHALNREVSEEEDVRFVIKEDGERKQIYKERKKWGLKDLLASGAFRAGLWALLMGVGFWLLSPHLPNPLGNMIGLGWIALAFGGGQGVMLMGLIVWGRLMWESYEISPNYFEKTTHGVFYRWRRQWKRTEIAALRVHERPGDKGRTELALEIVTGKGNVSKLAGGGAHFLRRLATVLRQELGVGAEGPGMRADDPLWHLRDEEEKPEKFAYEMTESEGRVVISKKWKGAQGGDWLVIFVWILFTAGAVLIPVIELPQVKKDDEAAMWMGTGVVAAFAVMLLLGILYEVSDRWVLVATPEEITFNRRSVFGKTNWHWDRNELCAVKTELRYAGNPKGEVWVVIVTTGGEKRLIVSKPGVARYVATRVRRATGLPAMPS